MPSFGETVYSDTASFGKFYAIMSAIVATFIAIGLIIAGIFIIRHRSHLKTVNGLVSEDSTCVTIVDGENKSSTCQTSVKYTINEKEYHTSLNSGTSSYRKGDSIIVFYNPLNPNDAELNPIPKGLGYGLIAVGVVTLISSWVWVWVTYKYKVAAVATGAKGVLDII